MIQRISTVQNSPKQQKTNFGATIVKVTRTLTSNQDKFDGAVARLQSQGFEITDGIKLVEKAKKLFYIITAPKHGPKQKTADISSKYAIDQILPKTHSSIVPNYQAKKMHADFSADRVKNV